MLWRSRRSRFSEVLALVVVLSLDRPWWLDRFMYANLFILFWYWPNMTWASIILFLLFFPVLLFMEIWDVDSTTSFVKFSRRRWSYSCSHLRIIWDVRTCRAAISICVSVFFFFDKKIWRQLVVFFLHPGGAIRRNLELFRACSAWTVELWEKK